MMGQKIKCLWRIWVVRVMVIETISGSSSMVKYAIGSVEQSDQFIAVLE
jgi:hypothetical protein